MWHSLLWCSSAEKRLMPRVWSRLSSYALTGQSDEASKQESEHIFSQNVEPAVVWDAPWGGWLRNCCYNKKLSSVHVSATSADSPADFLLSVYWQITIRTPYSSGSVSLPLAAFSPPLVQHLSYPCLLRPHWCLSSERISSAAAVHTEAISWTGR